MIARVGITQLSDQRNRLARTQEMAATGLRVNRPSDDPVDYRTILFLKDSMSQTGRFMRSIDLARTRIRSTEEALAGAADAVNLARVRGLEARNGTNQNDSTRDAKRCPGPENPFRADSEGRLDHTRRSSSRS